MAATQNAYLPTGLLQTEIDPLNYLTTHSYDPVGRRIATLDARGGIATTVYNLDGQVTAQVEPLGEG